MASNRHRPHAASTRVIGSNHPLATCSRRKRHPALIRSIEPMLSRPLKRKRQKRSDVIVESLKALEVEGWVNTRTGASGGVYLNQALARCPVIRHGFGGRTARRPDSRPGLWNWRVPLWELACLRWHRLGLPDFPRCLHRRQASSHSCRFPQLNGERQDKYRSALRPPRSGF